MMTPEQARQDYEAALATLKRYAASPGFSAAERLLIQDAMSELSQRFVDHVELEVGALAEQHQAFATSLGVVIDALEKGNATAAQLAPLTRIASRGAKAERPARRGGSRGARVSRAVGASRATGALRILCVHGIGHQEDDPAYEATWRDAIAQGLAEWSLARPFEIEFVAYDELFAADPPSAFDVAKALVKMGASGIFHGIGDLFRRRRGFGDVAESVRWTAGMVVQWAENDRLRAAARKRVLDHIQRFDPEVVLAHSLGSLLCYDAFARSEGRGLIAGRTFVSFGSQIGNPFVRSTLGGRIEPLSTAKHWYHLFNPNDDAFTASLRISVQNFEQVDAEFDVDGILDHDADAYLRHPNTTNVVWRTLALAADGARGIARDATRSAAMFSKHASKARSKKVEKPRRRALLVGINDYPNPADRLEGCVNDVFLMSSLLQESGFDAEDIRVVLNERATARGILDRLEWLLDGTDDGQERVFFYSGHGAQIPGYGVGEKVDHKDECLVAYDFDWSRERAVTDDQFYELYSQLPYDTSFLTIFDCCHSGGMTREGGARVRGLTPPDDIRHRELEWNAGEEMWVARDLNESEDRGRTVVAERRGTRTRGEARKKLERRFGSRGDVNRLGVSAPLRAEKRKFDAARKAFGHKGPFMPIILQACQEKQFSYEYRHGVQSFGAFTYSLGLILREAKREKRKLSWKALTDKLTVKLAGLHYDQAPALVCPSKLKTQRIPWQLK